MKSKKHFLLFLLFLLFIALAACGGQEQASNSTENESQNDGEKVDFPKTPITINVGFQAGGGTDVVTRAITELAQKYVPNNQNIVIVNKPGAGGVVALGEIMNTKPDGYNVVISPSGPLTLTSHFGDTPYKDLSGITPIINFTSDSYFLAVNGNSPIENLDDLVEYSKNNDLTFGSPGARGVATVAMKSLGMELGVEFTEIPFEGYAPARAALMGDHVVSVHGVESDLVPYFESGEIRPILYFGSKRHPNFPDVPNVTELGVDAFTTSFFMVGPKDLPIEIRDSLHDIFKQAVEDPSAEEMFEKLQATPDYLDPDDLIKLLQHKFDVNKKVIEESGLANK